jgi:uncharacterized membrane protein
MVFGLNLQEPHTRLLVAMVVAVLVVVERVSLLELQEVAAAVVVVGYMRKCNSSLLKSRLLLVLLLPLLELAVLAVQLPQVLLEQLVLIHLLALFLLGMAVEAVEQMRLTQVVGVAVEAVLPQDHRQQPNQAQLAEPVPQ